MSIAVTWQQAPQASQHVLVLLPTTTALSLPSSTARLAPIWCQHWPVGCWHAGLRWGRRRLGLSSRRLWGGGLRMLWRMNRPCSLGWLLRGRRRMRRLLSKELIGMARQRRPEVCDVIIRGGWALAELQAVKQGVWPTAGLLHYRTIALQTTHFLAPLLTPYQLH
jgi:hypothetical protein